MGLDIPLARGLERLLDEAKARGKSVVFAADEVDSVYTSREIWREFHMLATKHTTTLFIADGGSKVRAMVEKQGYEPRLRKWFPTRAEDLPPSLNQDKLTIQELWPLTTRQQYQKFLKENSVSLFNSLGGGHGEAGKALATRELDKRIDGAHILSGGRLRVMQRDGDEATFMEIPQAGTAGSFVLEKLARKQAFLSWDPFNTAAVTENEIYKWLNEWKRASADVAREWDVDINALLDANVLTMHWKEPGKYTFGTPDFYLQIRKSRPRVFVSLAWDDRHHPAVRDLRSELLRRNANVVICTDINMSQHAIPINDNLSSWMNEQARARAGHNVVVVLSDNYVKQAAVTEGEGGGSGVRKELACVVETLRKDSTTANEHVIVVGLDGKFDESWKAVDPLIEELTSSFVYPLQIHGRSVLQIVERVFGSAVPVEEPVHK
jgi:hypothetical protein